MWFQLAGFEHLSGKMLLHTKLRLFSWRATWHISDISPPAPPAINPIWAFHVLACKPLAPKRVLRLEVLAGCVCSAGTECSSVIANAGVASVASTIFVRVALGTLLERFGPVNASQPHSVTRSLGHSVTL